MSEPEQFHTKVLRGTLRSEVSMRKHTSWRAGGVVERMYQPADLEDLCFFIHGLPDDEPLYVVGLGSNLLVRDGGLRGTVLLMHGALRALSIDSHKVIYAQVGVPGAKLARFAALNDLSGAAFFAGVPGTLGGMLAMNAGCYGSETWDKVLRVQTVNRKGVLKNRTAAEYQIGYRHVSLKEAGSEWFVSALLKFNEGDGNVARKEIKELLNKRIASQPLQLPNAGSVFRNPPEDHAARLIQKCGLKGRRIGGAEISEKHANFIVNVGDAKSADIENLINEVRVEVEKQTGIQLHPEIRIVGEEQSG